MVEFGRFRYDPDSRLLHRGNEEIPLPPRVLALLECLLEEPGRIVPKEQLLATVWEGAFVGEDSLTQAISQLRHALDDAPQHPTYIQTVPRRGYRFIAEVSSEPFDAADAAVAAAKLRRHGGVVPPEVPGEPAAGRPPRRFRIAVLLGVAAAAAAVAWLAWPGGDPADRATDRDSAAAPAVDDEVPSIAVLPLENLGAEEEDYFADGMTEALIADLAKIDGLKVISRTSVMQYRDLPATSLPEIAARLGVAHVVAGSVLRADDRIRITAQLIDAREDRNVWAQSYERRLSDVLTLQGDLARTIVGEIRARVSGDEARRLGGDRRIDPEAYDAYLRGRYLHHRAVDALAPEFEELLQRALEQYRRAARLEPEWAQPHVGVCKALHWLASGVADRARSAELYGQAKAACLRALERDGSLSEAHAALGFVLHRADWDWDGAARAYRRAMELGGEGRWGYALYLRSAGRLTESIEHFRRARERSPEFAELDSQLARTLLCADRTEEAMVVARRLVERVGQPTFIAVGHLYLANGLAKLGRYDEALAEARAALAVDPEPQWILDEVGIVHALAGDLQAAAEIRDRLDLGDAASWEATDLDVLLGHEDRVVDLIRRHFEERSDWVLFMRCNLYTWDRLAPLPEVREIVEAIGFPAG